MGFCWIGGVLLVGCREHQAVAGVWEAVSVGVGGMSEAGRVDECQWEGLGRRWDVMRVMGSAVWFWDAFLGAMQGVGVLGGRFGWCAYGSTVRVWGGMEAVADLCWLWCWGGGLCWRVLESVTWGGSALQSPPCELICDYLVSGLFCVDFLRQTLGAGLGVLWAGVGLRQNTMGRCWHGGL